jgi:hypothetical protein
LRFVLGFVPSFFKLLLKSLLFVLGAIVILWACLAIYFSNLPWLQARLGLSIAFLVLVFWVVFINRRPRMYAVLAAVFVCIVVGWLSILPSHDRNWRPEVAVMPRAIIDGDSVKFTGVRNFDYRTRNDFTVRHEEREVRLSQITGIDFYVSYWREGPVGHTFLSFLFKDAPPLSISIETRPEVGEGFAPISSLFKQFELIYVVGEERDLVGVRAIHRGEAVYLYRLTTSAEDARRLFMIYLDRINELADRPEFYHLLSNSCTINIIRYANAIGRSGRLDIRHVLNGWIDQYLYYTGRLNSVDLPFAELRPRSLINEKAIAAETSPDFANRIRALVPTIPDETAVAAQPQSVLEGEPTRAR